MDNATLARGHGTELVRSSRLSHLFGSDIRCGTQFLNAKGSPVLTVETDFLVFPRRQTKHLESEQLQRAQKFTTAVKQERRVRPGEVHKYFGLLPIAIFGQRRVDNNAVFETEPAVVDDGLK